MLLLSRYVTSRGTLLVGVRGCGCGDLFGRLLLAATLQTVAPTKGLGLVCVEQTRRLDSAPRGRQLESWHFVASADGRSCGLCTPAWGPRVKWQGVQFQRLGRARYERSAQCRGRVSHWRHSSHPVRNCLRRAIFVPRICSLWRWFGDTACTAAVAMHSRRPLQGRLVNFKASSIFRLGWESLPAGALLCSACITATIITQFLVCVTTEFPSALRTASGIHGVSVSMLASFGSSLFRAVCSSRVVCGVACVLHKACSLLSTTFCYWSPTFSAAFRFQPA